MYLNIIFPLVPITNYSGRNLGTGNVKFSPGSSTNQGLTWGWPVAWFLPPHHKVMPDTPSSLWLTQPWWLRGPCEGKKVVLPDSGTHSSKGSARCFSYAALKQCWKATGETLPICPHPPPARLILTVESLRAIKENCTNSFSRDV